MKGYIRHKTKKSQNKYRLTEVQVKNFFISHKIYAPFSRFCFQKLSHDL